MTKCRDVGGHEGLGDLRYKRYCEAFDRVEHCVAAGYFLEAVALLDSLIWERLSSRLGFCSKKEVEIKEFAGKICDQLVGSEGKGGLEKDEDFRRIIVKIKDWLKRRNDAMHATAKVFRSDKSEEDLSTVLQSHKQTAMYGMELLRDFDLRDTESRAKAGKIPASSPYAFFPSRRGGTCRLSDS